MEFRRLLSRPPEIREIGLIDRTRGRRVMNVRIDAAKQRRNTARAELVAKSSERNAACVTQHEIEVSELARTDIGELLTFLQCLECDRCIEIVEDAEVDVR